MFSIGDTVKYAATGVCRITDITEKKFGTLVMQYYVLEPVHQKNALVYVPVQNKALVEKMKKLLTADEIEALIAGMPEYTVEWIDADTERAESYRAILSGGDRRALIGLIRTLYERQKELKEKHRHLRSADEQILKTAENMINDEFAVVLGIAPEDVVPYIMGKLTE